jgi:hypothetical protein
MNKFNILALGLSAGLLAGCQTNPQGSDWVAADFNKYDKNYSEFNTSALRAGMSKSQVLQVLGATHKVVQSNSRGSEVLAFEKWASVVGPDYVEETLYAVMHNNSLESWSISNNLTTIVPRQW